MQRPEWLNKFPAPWRWGSDIDVVDKVVLDLPKPIGKKEIEIKKGTEEGPTTASYLYE